MGLVGNTSPAFSSVTSDSGFEAADGNLAPNGGTPNFDWNTFGATTWSGTAPYLSSSLTHSSGWKFTGLTDAESSGSDTVFGGGTKQDDNCATVKNGPKPPNKDDLKRVYFSHKTVSVTRTGVTTDHVFLNLAWIRIPQNTTSASAHVAFEFNQGSTACGGIGGLVHRTAGDMLIVYDFEGSSTDDPHLKMLRWLQGTTFQPSSTCEVGTSRPCWGGVVDLTGGGFAEAEVNTDPGSGSSPILDTVAPSDDSLGTNEFGEAGIDLTDAGVFTSGTCLSFGAAFGVSRSSGNSAQAQMKDLVGPGSIDLRNCGALRILKQSTKTVTSGGVTTNPLVSQAGARFSVDGPDAGTDADFQVVDNVAVPTNPTTPVTVADGASAIGEICVAGLLAGSYTITETAAPTGYGLGTQTQAGTVGVGTDCSTTGKPTNANSFIWRDPPLADIQVRFRDGGSGETSLVLPVATNLTCVDGATTPPALGGTVDRTDTTGWDDTLTITGIAINPSPRTIVCTIVIDP